jgi:hypothetical protein
MKIDEANRTGNHKHIRDDDDSTDSELEDSRPKKRTKTRRVNEGGFGTNPRGSISIPYVDWVDLPEDHKVFVQSYNAKIKHNESVKELKVPDDLFFTTKQDVLVILRLWMVQKALRLSVQKVLRRLILKTRYLFRVRRRSDSTWNSQKILMTLRTRKNDPNSTGTHRL